MKKYDVKCPICGTINMDLFLEDTSGWLVCKKCKNKSLNRENFKMYFNKVPLLNDNQLKVLAKASAGKKQGVDEG